MTALVHSLDATAQNIESLVMPGEVISGHADVESECSSCHKPFNRSEQNSLCLDCHESVADDLEAEAGFHGKQQAVRDVDCSNCHTDHEGRLANIIKLNEAKFDHQFTDFELSGKHAETECIDCHKADEKHSDAPADCHSCHIEDDAHDGNLGTECGDCHTETDWTDVKFDHDATEFPLIGKHREVTCVDCHADQSFQNTPDSCHDCHAEDDVHDGRSGDQCENCHSPTDWTDTSFDHARDTDFALDDSHATLSCGDCHSDDPFGNELETGCVGCHLEDDNHDGHRGTECGDCHNSTEWATPYFRHDTDTDFVLNGAHPTVACADCHIEPIFEASPGTTCASCHLEDDVHKGKQGERCDSCHSESEWLDPPYFDHDLTRFPLLGEHGNIECEDCHSTQLFADTAGTCIDCHEEDNPHAGRFENNCNACHNPVAWDLWLFDHNSQTEFKLNGAHVDVSCDNCHRSSLTKMKKRGDDCADCHRADDVHDGEFGPDCGRCHSDRSFKEVRSLQ